MSPPSANDAALSARAAAPNAAAVARFARDLADVCDPRDTVLVAVSGGPDSLALLLLAHAVLGARCIAATVDHGLRGASAGEARWVARVCVARGIAHATLADDLPARAGRTANLSARARALRYGLLEAHAARAGASLIATAHHADDQRETMVMRLNRGAGVGGVAGIRARHGKVIRPLLGWRRDELAAIVAACALAAIDDPSNTDYRFDRARLRKELAGSDWLDASRWGDSAAALADADAALDWMTERLADERCRFGADDVVLDAQLLPAELLRRLVARCVTHLDPALVPRGSKLGALIAQLEEGRAAMLGNVIGRAEGARWHFARAPARRTI